MVCSITTTSHKHVVFGSSGSSGSGSSSSSSSSSSSILQNSGGLGEPALAPLHPREGKQVADKLYTLHKLHEAAQKQHVAA